MSESREKFHCNQCGMDFSSQNELNRHNKETHPAGGEEQLKDGGRG